MPVKAFSPNDFFGQKLKYYRKLAKCHIQILANEIYAW